MIFTRRVLRTTTPPISINFRRSVSTCALASSVPCNARRRSTSDDQKGNLGVPVGLQCDPAHDGAISCAMDIASRTISFKHCAQLWQIAKLLIDTASETQLQELLLLMAQQRVGHRPGRIEPRAIKRRPKPYPY